MFFSRSVSFGLAGLAALTAHGISGIRASAQTDTLLISTSSAVQVASERFAPFSPAGCLRFEPGMSLEPHPFVSTHNFGVIVGDVDANGEFDDVPSNIDAMTWNPTNRRPSVYDLIFSYSAASNPLRGGIVKDGDLIQLTPGGGYRVVISEATIASLTGTGAIDVDAAAYLPNGDFVFSFAEDEVTSDPALIAQNNNDPKLYDETVFTLAAGASAVTIRYTKAQMIAMATRATGTNLTSIVDTAGLTADPANNGEILFTTGSSSVALGGKVFTTANGGAIATLNGVAMDGQSQWGLKSRPVIDALTRVQAGKDPMTLSLDAHRIVTPASASVTISVDGAGSGGTVQLFVSYAKLPYPTPWTLRPPLGAIGYAYVTNGDPLFYNSTKVGAFSVPIDDVGHGNVRLGVGHIPPGVTFIFQGVDLSNFEVSEPIALSLVAS